MNPWLGIAIVLAALAALTALAGVARRRGWLQPEDARKLVHVALGLCVAAFPLLFSERWPVLVLAGLAIGVLLPLRRAGSRLGAALHDVRRDSWGEVCFPLAAAVIWCLAPGDPLRFSIPILVLASADAAAAVIGVRYGRTALTSGTGRKSWEGAAAFAITAYLAKGYSVPDAVRAAKAYITQALRHAKPIGGGHSPVHHFHPFYPLD